MWIWFNEKELQALKDLVESDWASASPDAEANAAVIRGRIAHYEAPDANNQQFRDAIETSDDLEMDDDAVTSVGDEGGWVMTWTWVSNEEAGIEPDDEDGDGDD